jgi:aryl-alcohol dehydrogenase-like predicted oxidoreductase
MHDLCDDRFQTSPGYTRREAILSLGALAAAVFVAGFPFGEAEAAAAGLAKRPIPRTGELLPVIGIGTSRVFDLGSDLAEREPHRKVLDAMIAGGATVIDTAPSYGRSESLVGELLQERKLRDRFFLATKVGVKDPAGQRAEMAQSLTTLRTSKVDLMQLHNVRMGDTSLELLREFQKAGRTRYIGITHWMDSSHDTLAEVIAKEKPDFVQVNYSLDARNAEARVLPAAKDNGVAVLVNVPFGRNRLFSAVKGRALPAFAEEMGAASWAQLFLKFILANDAVTCIIPGTDDPKHMADNLAAGNGPRLTAAQRQQILDYWTAQITA